MAVYANYITYQIFQEAGLPAGVIQFVPGPAEAVVGQAIAHPEFAALHFTGSTFVFRKLWKDIALNLDSYKGYPRIVGETGMHIPRFEEIVLICYPGGKNFHVIHSSADIKNAVMQSIRSGFEYQGERYDCLPRSSLILSVLHL